MISTYPVQSIVLLRVTPSANRNSYRVATPYYIYTQGSVLRPQPWAGESQLLQSCCCLRVFQYGFLSAHLHMGMRLTQKAVGTAGGFALVVMSPMPVGKQVFLLGIGAISTVMPRMTPAMTTVKKAAVGGKKSPAGADTKTAALKGPLPGPPQGAGIPTCCVLGCLVELLPLGEGWDGASGVGEGPQVLARR